LNETALFGNTELAIISLPSKSTYNTPDIDKEMMKSEKRLPEFIRQSLLFN